MNIIMISAIKIYTLSSLLAKYYVPIMSKLLDYLTRLIFPCWFPHSIKVGKGVVLGYGGLSVVVHGDAVIGNNVHIDQCVTIGGNGTRPGVPVIEDNVYIGAGAKILGPVVIGNGSVIGANAVLLKDISPGSVAVGIPVWVIQSNIDRKQKLYGSAAK